MRYDNKDCWIDEIEFVLRNRGLVRTIMDRSVEGYIERERLGLSISRQNTRRKYHEKYN